MPSEAKHQAEDTSDEEKEADSFSIRKTNYFQTEALGEGSFGAVVTVFNDDGESFAMKAFELETEEIEDSEDEDCGEEVEYPTLDLGTLREISTLRMFSKISDDDTAVEHPGIMKLHDVAVVMERTSMIMPKYSCNLATAISNKILSNKQKLAAAHMLLQTVAFLHKNEVIHRDIKCENILLDEDMRAVLCDFSLAKLFDGKLAGDTHSDGVGTACYKAPEVYREEGYGLPADVYSVGVVVLELFNGMLAFDRDKAALNHIEGVRAKLGDKAIPALLKGLLDPDPASRLTAEAALALPVFEKLQLAQPIEKVISKTVHVPGAELSAGKKGKKKAAKKKSKGKKDRRDPKRRKTGSDDMDKLMSTLEFVSPLTKLAARIYHEKSGSPLQDCVYLAGKLYEQELLSVSCVEDYLDTFDYDVYAEEELKIFRAMDFCLWV